VRPPPGGFAGRAARAAAIAWVLAGAARADDVQPKDAGGALAREVRVQVRKRINLSPRWTPPIFYHSSPLLLVDRGRSLYVGRGALQTPDLVYLLPLDSLEERMLIAPIAAFAGEHSELALKREVEDLLCYEPEDGLAGVLVLGAHGDAKYFLRWDLAKGVVTEAILLGKKGPATRWIGVQAMGYDPVRRECILHVEQNDGEMRGATAAGGPYTESVVAVGDSARTIATFSAPFIISHGPYFDAIHRRVVLTEVTELEGARPHGYLVDLSNGGVRPFPIPQLVYALTFDPDGRSLYAYSVKTREMVVINAATGATTQRARIGDSGHALGWLGRDTLVLIGNVRIHLLDPHTLGHRGQVPTGRIINGLLTADGSFVFPGGMAVVDFTMMSIARLEP